MTSNISFGESKNQMYTSMFTCTACCIRIKPDKMIGVNCVRNGLLM